MTFPATEPSIKKKKDTEREREREREVIIKPHISRKRGEMRGGKINERDEEEGRRRRGGRGRRQTGRLNGRINCLEKRQK